MIKKIINGLKKRWYVLPKWERHSGGSVVLMMIAAGFMQKFCHGIDWTTAATVSIFIGVVKEAFEKNTVGEAMTDITLNMGGIGFALWVLSILGNKI